MDAGMIDQFLAWIVETAPKYPFWFTFDFSRYLIGAGSVYLLVNVLLSRALKNRKIKKKKAGFRQMAREFKSSIVAAAVFSASGFFIDLGIRADVITIYGDMALYGTGYFIASLIFMIVAQDAYFYWTHRLLHLPRMMKRGHTEHHKSIIPTPWTAYSFNVIEAGVHAAFVPLFLLILPMHGLAIFLFLTHMIIRNAVGHSGYEIFPRSWAVHPILGQITMVTHHDMHHTSGNSNFGLYFTWWDRMMGTEHSQYLAKATGNPGAVRKTVGLRATAATIAACVGLMATAIASPVKAQDDDISGLWVAGNGATVVEVANCSEKSRRLCGTVIYNDAGADAEMGMTVLKGFKAANVQGMKRWESGKVAHVGGGKAKKGKLVLLDSGALKVSACGKSNRCKNETWVRPTPALAQKAGAALGGR
ncbi:sterol desaturase family protein [Kordiimonas aquimaris]|uniref:sterol desaturase family protein n=1 Tax=Kordiimonas aquimaris TaxID=707591 RepID=UPI0021D2F5ED|nr:sterol desaturase family protein [Kordiimonas aquimaris]